MAASAANNKGFSLIELLVAVVILLVSLLGLLAALMNTISANLDDELRNNAVRLTSQTAEALHGLPIDDDNVTGSPEGILHTRSACDSGQDRKGLPCPVQNIRGFKQDYIISWNVTDKDDNLKEILISVAYTNAMKDNNSYKAVIYKHRTM